MDAAGLTGDEARALRAFAERGGRVIAAGEPRGWTATLLRNRDLPDWDDDGPESARRLAGAPETAGVARVKAAGDGRWTRAGDAQRALAGDEGSLLLLRQAGRGRIALLADSSPLQNRLLDEDDNAALALALGGRGPLTFVESVHGYGPQRGLELRHIGDRQRRAHHQHVLHQREQRDRLEILDRIIAGLGRHQRRERMGRDRAREQRVAVGRRARRGLRADLAASAAAIVDHEGAAEDGGHFRRDDADDRVVGAPGRIRRDQPDGTIRIGLGNRGLREQRETEENNNSNSPGHSTLSLPCASWHHRRGALGRASSPLQPFIRSEKGDERRWKT